MRKSALAEPGKFLVPLFGVMWLGILVNKLLFPSDNSHMVWLVSGALSMLAGFWFIKRNPINALFSLFTAFIWLTNALPDYQLILIWPTIICLIAALLLVVKASRKVK